MLVNGKINEDRSSLNDKRFSLSRKVLVWPLPTSLPPICTTSDYFTQMSAHVELVSKSQNTSGKTVGQPHTLERTRVWPSGADFRDKLWGSKKELPSSSKTSTSKLDMTIHVPAFVNAEEEEEECQQN